MVSDWRWVCVGPGPTAVLAFRLVTGISGPVTTGCCLRVCSAGTSNWPLADSDYSGGPHWGGSPCSARLHFVALQWILTKSWFLGCQVDGPHLWNANSLRPHCVERWKENRIKSSVLFPHQERMECWRHKLIAYFWKNGQIDFSQNNDCFAQSFNRKTNTHTRNH